VNGLHRAPVPNRPSALAHLPLSEQHVPRLVVVGDGAALFGQHLDASAHRGAASDFVEPALEVRVVAQSMPWFFQERSQGQMAMSAIEYSLPPR
jgi:hypothetical protein